MPTILTTEHKRINLPHSSTIVQFDKDGRAEVSKEVAEEVLDNYGTSVVLLETPKKSKK